MYTGVRISAASIIHKQNLAFEHFSGRHLPALASSAALSPAVAVNRAPKDVSLGKCSDDAQVLRMHTPPPNTVTRQQGPDVSDKDRAIQPFSFRVVGFELLFEHEHIHTLTHTRAPSTALFHGFSTQQAPGGTRV